MIVLRLHSESCFRDRGSEPVLDRDERAVGEGAAELPFLMAKVVGYDGKVLFDSTKADGTPRKLLDISRVRALGWAPRMELKDGLESAYEWALSRDCFK